MVIKGHIFMKNMIAILVLIICVSGAMYAGTTRGTNSLAKDETVVNWIERKLQGFDMRVWLSNKMTMGEQAWDAGTGAQIPLAPHFGLEYPTGSGIEHIFGAGPRIGGVLRGRIIVSEGYNGNTAGNEFIPANNPRIHFWRTKTGTPIGGDPEGWSGYYYNHGILTNTRGYDDDHDGKIDEDDLDGIDNDGDWNPATDDVGADGLPDSLEVSCDGEKYDPILNPDPAQDNYDPSTRDKCHPNPLTGVFPYKNDKDVYTEKNGIPDHGEPHVDEDYGAVSDNDLYCSATDVFSNPPYPGHVPLGIQIIQKSYAWENGADGILPFEYDFININNSPTQDNTIHDVWVGFFADMDVGPSTRNPNFYQNNLAGYIDSLRTAYIYNPVDVGSTPLGVTILKTPRPLDSLTYIFHWFANAADEPVETADSACYAWLSGAAFAPNYIEPNQTQISDTRFFFSFGPFQSIAPGDTLKIELALVGGYSVGVYDAQNPSMVQRAQFALLFHGNGYHPPFQPTSPTLNITPGFKKVDLAWGSSAGPGAIDPVNIWDDSSRLAGTFPDTSWRLKHLPCNQLLYPLRCINGNLPGCKNFLGYRLYRYEDHRTSDQTTPPPASDFTLIRQWDDADKTVQFNPQFPTYGTGIQTTFTDTGLVRGRHYWYAVTSFILPDFQVNQVVNILGDTSIITNDTVRTPILESNIVPNDIYIPFSQSTKLGEVLAVPNPYRVDQSYTPNNGGWETGKGGLPWTEQDRLIRFIHLPKKCTIRIFDLVGGEIGTIQFDAQKAVDPSGNPDPNSGSVDWPIFSSSNRALASGVYIFTVESEFGTQVGKFVLIR